MAGKVAQSLPWALSLRGSTLKATERLCRAEARSCLTQSWRGALETVSPSWICPIEKYQGWEVPQSLQRSCAAWEGQWVPRHR